MKTPRFSKKIRFLPWIGKNYWSGRPQGQRLLIIGESHYSGRANAVEDDRQNPWLTRDVIKRQWNGENYSFHRKLAQTILGRPLQDNEIRPFWESVAFYNFVQDIVGVGPGVRPKERHWRAGLELLPEVIERLEPDYVIATGSILWKRLPSWEPDKWLTVLGEKIETCAGRTKSGHGFRSTYINHPASWGFGNGSRWTTAVKKFFALPRTGRKR